MCTFYLIICSVTIAKSFEWDSVLKSYWVKSEDNLYIAQCSGMNLNYYEFYINNKI